MKTHIFHTLLVFLLIPGQGAAQTVDYWRQTTGPYAGGITATLVRSNGTILVSTQANGLYRSTIGGGLWTTSSTMPSTIAASVFRESPAGEIFAGTGDGVYRSSNDGIGWTRSSAGLNGVVTGFAFHPNGDYFASSSSAVFRSTNHGNTWTQVWDGHQPLRWFTVNGMAVQSTGRLFIASNAGARFSTDLGVSWHTRNDSSEGLWESLATSDLYVGPQDQVMGVYSYGAFRATDYGLTWEHIFPPINSFSTFSLAMTPAGEVYLGASKYSSLPGLFRSTNYGTSWNRLPPDSSLGFLHLSSASSGSVVGATALGVLLSADRGITCQIHSLPTAIVKGMVSPSRARILAGISSPEVSRLGLHLSTDAGLSWTPLKNPGMYDIGNIVQLTTDIILVAEGATLSRTSDGGQTWSSVELGEYYGTLSIVPLDSSGLILAANSATGTYRSSDYGATWSLASQTPVGPVLRTSDGKLLGARQTSILESTDNGTSWSSISPPLSSFIYSLADGPHGLIFAGTDNGVLRSENHGRHWLRLASPTGWTTPLVVNSTGHIFAVNVNGVIRSKDRGQTWQRLQSGMAGSVTNLAVDPDGYLNAGTSGNGIFRSIGSTTQLVVIDDTIAMGNVPVGESRSRTIVVRNGGPEILSIESVVSSRPDYRVTPTSATLSPGESTIFTVRFSPQERGIQVASIIFSSSANSSPDYVTCTGRGRYAADMRMARDSIDFPQAAVSETREAATTIFNDGYDTLRVETLSTTNAQFSATIDSREIPPDSQATLRVTFAPVVLGHATAYVLLRSNSVTSPDSIALSGEATVHGSVRKLEEAAGKYLSQNFPNPVHVGGAGATGPLIRIRFAIPSAGKVRFSIFNIAGQEVARVFDEELQQETFEVSLPALSLASGVYFYRITAPGFVATRKMLILK
jgi:photosystem II stability/assembly factor-like uncharacterized protein